MAVYNYSYLGFSSGHGGDGVEYSTFLGAWRERDRIIRKSKRDDKHFPIDHTIAITIEPYGEDAVEFGIVYAVPEYKNYVAEHWFEDKHNYDIFMEVLDKYYSTNKPQRGEYV